MQLKPHTAWIFDVDGVLTNNKTKKVAQLEIYNELIKRIEKGDPGGLNTGRSSKFVIEEILTPLAQALPDQSQMKHVFVEAEKGAVCIRHNKLGKRIVTKDENIYVPKSLQKYVEQLIRHPSYANIMLFDTTKETMISIELKSGENIEEFQNVQKDFVKVIREYLKNQKLDDNFKVDPTTICTDIERIHVGKALGIRKLIELFKKQYINPLHYICFGDSASDIDMMKELELLNKSVQFVFVGEKNKLKPYRNKLVQFTHNHGDRGTLEYLKNHE